jgi:ferric-dicitrate binding protein FerR (iron transport regulator)
MRWTWRVAAAVAVMAFAVVLTLVLQRDRGMTKVTVAEGDVQLVELADGSTVRLLGGATLTYTEPARATAFNRRVTITGRAFFDIVRSQQGFTVETPTALTTVLGTTFGIQAEEDVMEVVLATGSISVASKEAREQVVVLQPGQMSRVVRNTVPSSPAPVDVAEALVWTGLFLFQATPLGEAAEDLSERYGVRVTVAPDLVSEGVYGTFAREESLAQILNTLAATLGAVVQGNETEGYSITPKPAP